MTESFIIDVNEVAVDAEQLERENIIVHPPTLSAPSDLIWLETEEVTEVLPVQDYRSTNLSRPTPRVENETSSPVKKIPFGEPSEDEMLAAAALLELSQMRKWCFSFTKDSKLPVLYNGDEISIDIPLSVLRWLLIENVKVLTAFPTTENVFNFASDSDIPSEQRATLIYQEEELVSSAPENFDLQIKDNTRIPKNLVDYSLKDQDFLKDLSSSSIRRSKLMKGKDEVKFERITSDKRDSIRMNPKIQSKREIKATPVLEKLLPSTDPMMFSCSTCPKKYASSSNLTRHQQVHRNPKSAKAMTCDTCKKVYVSRSAFMMHLHTHNKMYTCPFCFKAFSRKWTLESHVRSHTGEKPFACYLCSRPFADRSNMRAHTFTHQQGTRLSCPLCDKVFWVSPYYKRHLKKVHNTTSVEVANRKKD